LRASPVGEEDPTPEETMRRPGREVRDAVYERGVDALAPENLSTSLS
jgi:hypothetical protein